MKLYHGKLIKYAYTSETAKERPVRGWGALGGRGCGGGNSCNRSMNAPKSAFTTRLSFFVIINIPAMPSPIKTHKFADEDAIVCRYSRNQPFGLRVFAVCWCNLAIMKIYGTNIRFRSYIGVWGNKKNSFSWRGNLERGLVLGVWDENLYGVYQLSLALIAFLFFILVFYFLIIIIFYFVWLYQFIIYIYI